MELKDYQQTALDSVDSYLTELSAQRAITQASSEYLRQHPELELPQPDFPRIAWNKLKNTGQLPTSRSAYQYISRSTGAGVPLPNVCLKIPTGGGKTLIGAHAVSSIMGKYLQSNHGFVLWIVPNEAIYAQTKKQLADRENPIRQILDRAAAGRVKLLEKDDPLNALDVQSHLCVMLLMLQSANRVTKETLRLFRDRGNVHGFFPAEDDMLAHIALAQRIPNLDRYLSATTAETTIKDSLGNVLRLLQPVIVMDEGHKAYTPTAVNTIAGFNPSFVLELSATPKDTANWLVDVRGAALQSAEMIKLPINVKVKAGDDWKDCLRESLDKLTALQKTADRLRNDTARYIRPILLVQVERTGKEMRDGTKIHAEDAKDFLLSLGLDQSQIAIKTADTNDLEKPENANLLSPICAVRVIITVRALQEGWDCPFAYVLCTLATNRNLNALTQLIGRILRQPQAALVPADSAALNESYVFCHHAATEDVVLSIKKGLESDGMGDLVSQVRETDGTTEGKKNRRKLPRRDAFRTLQIFLPLVNWVEGGVSRPLDYEQDVLYRLDWNQLNLAGLIEKLSATPEGTGSFVVRVGFATQGKEWLERSDLQSVYEATQFDTVYATRLMVDVVPNPWVARALIGDMLTGLKSRGFDDEKLGTASSFILEELRKWLLTERDRLAESKFLEDVDAERIQFRLRADRATWEMPSTTDTDRPENAPQMPRRSGAAIGKSIFTPVYKEDFNPDEAEFACYLDEQAALQWWHRNVAKSGNYALQGWKRNRVYPDFIFGHQKAGKKQRIVVWETKGDQLEGNLDTTYKKKLLETMTASFKSQNVVPVGELELVGQDGAVVSCEMILISEWKTALNRTLLEAD